MIDSESHVSVGETGTNGTVKVGFLLTHLNTWNHPAGFLSHDVLAGEVMSHSVPERNLIVALIKGEKKGKNRLLQCCMWAKRETTTIPNTKNFLK